MYIVRILKPAIRELEKLDKKVGQRMVKRIEWLAGNLEK